MIALYGKDVDTVDKRTAVALAAAQMAEVAASRTLQPFNLREVDVDARPVRDPEWVIRGGSTMADLNTQAIQLLLLASKQTHVDEVHPNFLALHQVAENLNEIVATAVAAEGQNTVRITWAKDDSRAMVNIRLLLRVRPFSISPRVSVHIPVTLETVEGVGPAQILHLDRIYTVPMTERPTRVPPESSGGVTTE